MNWIRRWAQVRRMDAELAEEMRAHMAEHSDSLVKRGYRRIDANELSSKRFGNVTQQQERSRDAWNLASLENLLNDVRFAGRALMRSPLLSLSAVLTLALGVGVNTAVFTVTDHLLLRPLPVKDPDQLVQLRTTGPVLLRMMCSPTWF